MSMFSARRVKRMLAAHSFRPSRRRGQSFMVDRNLAVHLVELADVSADDIVLEVGAGFGALTALLAERAGRVVAVEVDKRLARLAAEHLQGCPNVYLVERDILAGKHRLEPAVVAALQRFLGAQAQAVGSCCAEEQSGPAGSGAAGCLKVVSNLPYSVATPVISNLLESQLPIQGMWLTVQKELAERLTATCGTPEYGPATVLAAVHADIRVERVVAASVFWPRPQVDSAIIVVTPVHRRGAEIADYELLKRVVAGVFQSRRKRLPNAMRACGLVADAPGGVEEMIHGLGIRADARPGDIAPEKYVRLANLLALKQAEGAEQHPRDADEHRQAD